MRLRYWRLLVEPFHYPFNNSMYVQQMIASECALGQVAGPFICPPFDNFMVSPLGLVPKKEAGAFRLIHDLSFPKGDSVNCGIPRGCCSVAYEDFDYFVSLLAQVGQGCYITKADIESAFRIIPMHPLDYHLLGFMMGNQYFTTDVSSWGVQFHAGCSKTSAVPCSGS